MSEEAQRFVDADRPGLRPFLPTTSAFHRGADSPSAYLERCLEAAERWEPRIGAFVCRNVESARTAAAESTARWHLGQPLSPVDGLPVGVKDIIETYDMPTEFGSPLFEGHHGGEDAAAVAALRAAGAVVLGKTVTTEFAAAQPGRTRNPWDPRRTPGGSSSGSAAAVGAGLVPAALGTQVLGSLIRPAGYCGVYGFKPSVGALNRGGAGDSRLTQSVHGVLAASLPECWAVAHAIAVRAGGDPGYTGLTGPSRPGDTLPSRLALLQTPGWADVSDGARTACSAAVRRFRDAGVEIVDRAHDPAVEAVELAIAEARLASGRIVAWESRWPLVEYRRRGAHLLSASIRQRLSEAEAMNSNEYGELLAAREAARDCYQRLAADVDGCLTLSAPAAAPLGLTSTGDSRFAAPSSYLGVPAVSLPVLHDADLPLGLQLMGFRDADSALVSIALAADALWR